VSQAVLNAGFGAWAALLLAGHADAAEAPFASAVQARALTAVAQHVTPGLSVAVVYRGRTVYAQGFGVAAASGAPVSPETRFPIGSLTKQFTAALTLLLARDGKLKLENPRSAYLPQIPNARKIELLQLLYQTSGLHNYPDTREHPWPLHGSIPPEEILALLAMDRSDFAPGSRWEYSNANYAVLAALAARAAGMPYGELLARRIFGPLGMHRSGYGFASLAPDAAQPWAAGRWLGDGERISPDLFYGAGGMLSTASDLARWDAALLGRTLLNERDEALLWSPGALSDGSRTSYGMGFIPAQIDGHPEVWHNGYAPGVGGHSYNAIFPADSIAVVVLTNSAEPAAATLTAAIARDVFEAYVPPQAAAGEDPAITKRVRDLLGSLRNGGPDRAGLTPSFSEFLTPAIASSLKSYFSALGDPSALLFVGSESSGAETKYTYRGSFAGGSVHDVYLWVSGGKISGFQVPP
jgi:D-alanyl-D-alanine carboxypeptidase